uniref:albumin-binding GA domain-containing protein n=1 Tax=uncultured Anaerococcus sp. TaxID=293428 RepID=UPI00262BE9BC
ADAGITGQIFIDKVNKANTLEGLDSLVAEIKASHAKSSEQKPDDHEKEEGQTLPDSKIKVPSNPHPSNEGNKVSDKSTKQAPSQVADKVNQAKATSGSEIKTKNVKTGISSISGFVLGLVSSLGAFFSTKKKED